MFPMLVPLVLAGTDTSCRAVTGLDAKQVVRTAMDRTGLNAAAHRSMRIAGYDLRDHAAESDRSYGPALVDVTNIEEVFDPRTGVEKTATHTSIAGLQFGDGTTISDEHRAFSVRDSSVRASEALHADAWSTRPLNVWAVLLDWDAAPDIRVAARCVFRDYSRLVLSRNGLRGQERLFVDEKSGYPTKLDRVEPHYLWGQVDVEFLYSTWRLIDGIHVPGGAFRIADGKPVVTRVFADIRLEAQDSEALVLPAGAAMGFAPDPFMRQVRPDTIRVSATTFLLRNAGFTETVTLARDTVFLFDATQGDERARYDAEWIATLFPGPHPMVVVVSDLAWPHIAGVRYWVAHGATIVSHRASRAFLERVVARHWTREPDVLEKNRPHSHLRFRAVADSVSLGGGAILLFPIDGAASEVALAAFVRKDRLLWASDFIQDLDAPSQYLEEVAAAVRRVHADPSLFAAEHLSLSAWDRAAALSVRRE